MADRLKVCICGGGNGAHLMTGLASAHTGKPDVRVLILYQDEAAKWTQNLGNDQLLVVRQHPDGKVEEIRGKPSIITKDPTKAVPGADIIIFCVPAFAHQQYFEAIAPHVKDNAIIAGLPGQSGFEFQCYSVLKDKAKACVILNFETLPWPCRIEEYGRKVNQLGIKEYLMGARVVGPKCKAFGKDDDPVKLLQSLLGDRPVLKQANSYLEILLMTKGFFHPSILYGQWKDWDGKPLDKEPLFYQGLTELAAEYLDKISEEVISVGKKISEKRPDVKMDNVDSVASWVLETYRPAITDTSSLLTCFRTNGAYKGLLHPMTKLDSGKFEPNFKYRYMAEDVPFAMTVEKGVAQLAGVDTPYLDTVLTWAQGKLGKEYLQGGKLSGKDVKETRAPQAFGFNKLEDLLALI